MEAKHYIWTKNELRWLEKQGIDLSTYIGQPVKLPKVRRTRPTKQK